MENHMFYDVALGFSTEAYNALADDVKNAINELFGEALYSNILMTVFRNEKIESGDESSSVHDNYKIVEQCLQKMDFNLYGIMIMSSCNPDIERHGSPEQYGINYVRKIKIHQGVDPQSQTW